ncbi:MAG: prepilin-type N-terminal cleavage/methylation domain-containing protein [Candidatus Omnitrophica bacterium]|nr:prepilin-type N-terminal cleavage/methylation domain-containing protein [Candidatus Omnitrophota bacterium]MBI3021182.1 prepilin-type N-terminal cleavage/methylation domain-containing protein [Candidatus Omnitrophota bacterium]MBI3083695.1 prepilin-type N-terminal cleavage/methylation domain-containing protein [Candidatus Omnitrophota bacterium]
MARQGQPIFVNRPSIRLSRSGGRGRAGKAAGFSLVEVLVASVIGTVVVGGSMMAFVAASRMMQTQNTPAFAEAAGYAQQTLEKYRNMIACDSPWFNPATCAPLPLNTWTEDSLPLPGSGGTESFLSSGVKRCYQVTPQDCDGTGGVGDCLKVEAQVCWNGASCSC